jgi:hypothetical protein
MGLLHNHDDGGRKFVMREKLLSIGDDFWIEDGSGQKVFKVDGKAMRRARPSFSRMPLETRSPTFRIECSTYGAR